MRVLLFASYADAIGAPSIEVPWSPGQTVRDVVAAVRALPGARAVPPTPLVAVNLSYAADDQVLIASDEVAIIPPVAGG